MKLVAATALALFASYGLNSSDAFHFAPQQVADPNFRPPVESPAYPAGKGPIILLDEGHDNFHTVTGRYLPFAELLRRDGYVVVGSAAPFTDGLLRSIGVLAIANARRPFEPSEILAVREWVTKGGSLLLIADHPPNVAPALELAKAFGVRFHAGTAVRESGGNNRLVFRRSEGTLADHPLTRNIDQVATFTGSGFQVDDRGEPLLIFGDGVRLDGAGGVPLKGHLQGAVVSFGQGKVAVFGEAAMFSAQLAGPEKTPMGMNADIARQNPQFLLNVMHWLTNAPAAPRR